MLIPLDANVSVLTRETSTLVPCWKLGAVSEIKGATKTTVPPFGVDVVKPLRLTVIVTVPVPSYRIFVGVVEPLTGNTTELKLIAPVTPVGIRTSAIVLFRRVTCMAE